MIKDFPWFQFRLIHHLDWPCNCQIYPTETSSAGSSAFVYKSQTLLSYLLLMMLLLGIIFFSKPHVLEAYNIANHIQIVIFLKIV